MKAVITLTLTRPHMRMKQMKAMPQRPQSNLAPRTAQAIMVRNVLATARQHLLILKTPQATKRPNLKRIPQSPNTMEEKSAHSAETRWFIYADILFTMHSKINERIPVSKVEALMQASKHGQQTSGGQVVNKNKDGSLRVNQRKKMVCPLCESVTMYLTIHLQRVHKLAKGSEAYKDAIQNKRRYMGKQKEVKQVERAIKKVKPKKRSARKNSLPDNQQPALSKTPLQILVEEADLSNGSNVEFGDIVPLTLPVIEQKNPPPLPVIEQPTMELSNRDSDEDYQEEEEDDDDENDDEFITLKDYYAKGVAKTDREKFYVMFCEHLKNIIGGRPLFTHSMFAKSMTIWTPKRKIPLLN